MPENQEDNPIWTRQKGEPSKSYGLFCIYRDMGASRTYKKVVEELKKRASKGQSETFTKGGLSHHASKWHWVERAEAYDDYIDENFRTKHEKHIMEMRIRHADQAKGWQDEVIKLKKEFSKIANVSHDDFKSPNSLAWFLESLMKTYGQAVMIEQDALGESEGSGEEDESKRREQFVRLFQETEEDTENRDGQEENPESS